MRAPLVLVVNESFTALLEMIDSRPFSRGALLYSNALKDATVRRLKRDLAAKGFKNRVVKALAFTPSDDETEMFDLLDEIVTKSAKANGTNRGRHRDDVGKEALSLEPLRLRVTLSHYLTFGVGRGLTDDDYDDIFGEGQSDEEEGLWEQDESERLRESKGSDPLSAAKPGQLETLMEWGLSYESRMDSRRAALFSLLEHCATQTGSTG